MALDIIPDRALIDNARGLAFAAFAARDAIARALGCSAEQAAAFQCQALDRFQGLMFKVTQARRTPGTPR